jgi:hypothetical protein
VTVGEQLPWPSTGMGESGGGDVDEEFEDSLGDFDESIAGGDSAAGGDEDIDILDPMGGAAGAPGDGPLFEEGDSGEGGDSAENQSIAQRAASGSGGSSNSSSSGGQQGSSASGGSESSSEQSQNQNAAGAGGSGGGGAGAQEGDRTVGSATSGGAQQGGEDIIPIPEDVGDGRNDDIVLRQIREAALNERDPVLREKLWDEYRRIKGSR